MFAGADFHGADPVHAVFFTFCFGAQYPFGRVMVGQRKNFYAGFPSPVRHLLGGGGAVGTKRMGVQIRLEHVTRVPLR